MAKILFIDFLIVLCYHLLSITACMNFMKLTDESHSPQGPLCLSTSALRHLCDDIIIT